MLALVPNSPTSCLYPLTFLNPLSGRGDARDPLAALAVRVKGRLWLGALPPFRLFLSFFEPADLVNIDGMVACSPASPLRYDACRYQSMGKDGQVLDRSSETSRFEATTCRRGGREKKEKGQRGDAIVCQREVVVRLCRPVVPSFTLSSLLTDLSRWAQCRL